MNDYWCIPPKENAEFVANMEDILDIDFSGRCKRQCSGAQGE